MEQQWQSVFGDFVDAPQEGTSAAPSGPNTAVQPAEQEQNTGGFLPSQLLDLMSMENGSGERINNLRIFLVICLT